MARSLHAGTRCYYAINRALARMLYALLAIFMVADGFRHVVLPHTF
jgi:hypothetical protein